MHVRPGLRLLIALLAAATLIASLVSVAAASAAVAPGAPGSASYFDLARKDCVGTARNTTSKVWFTVADGVLSDTYWPTVDATNVHTLQYLVTDGKSFTDLQTRDMTYKVLDDPTGMACTVIASRREPSLQDQDDLPDRPVARRGADANPFQGPSRDQLYVRLDPLAGGTGGGGAQNGGGNTAGLATVDGGPVPVASTPTRPPMRSTAITRCRRSRRSRRPAASRMPASVTRGPPATGSTCSTQITS